MVYFHFHLDCQHITDNEGGNELYSYNEFSRSFFAFQLAPFNE